MLHAICAVSLPPRRLKHLPCTSCCRQHELLVVELTERPYMVAMREPVLLKAPEVKAEVWPWPSLFRPLLISWRTLSDLVLRVQVLQLFWDLAEADQVRKARLAQWAQSLLLQLC